MSTSPFVDLRLHSLPTFVPEVKNVAPIKPPFIQTKEQIDSLTSINGLSIEEIERRARPDCYAMTGFLGPNESFKEVLKHDWETVEKHNTTHEELVNHLRNIIALAEKQQESASDLLPSPDHHLHVEYNGQPLLVDLWTTRGLQYDIFCAKNESERTVDTPKSWNDDYVIRHATNGAKVIVTTGVLSYIREFGFYEGGGNDNRYRIDPETVIAIVKGN